MPPRTQRAFRESHAEHRRTVQQEKVRAKEPYRFRPLPPRPPCCNLSSEYVAWNCGAISSDANTVGLGERAKTTPRRWRRLPMSPGIFISAPRCYIQRTEPPLHSGFVGCLPATLLARNTGKANSYQEVSQGRSRARRGDRGASPRGGTHGAAGVRTNVSMTSRDP